MSSDIDCKRQLGVRLSAHRRSPGAALPRRWSGGTSLHHGSHRNPRGRGLQAEMSVAQNERQRGNRRNEHARFHH